MLDKLKDFIHKLWIFGLKQANAAIFGGLLLAAILITAYYFPFKSIYRYDFLFIYAITIQILLLVFKLENRSEFLVIILFHTVATAMEVFKTSTSIGSWSYPENSWIRIAGVPLFAGFMYSAVGSYITRAWKLHEFVFSYFPEKKMVLLLGSMMYINFFTHHYIWDFRWLLMILSGVIFFKTKLYFKLRYNYYSMPLLLGFLLVALFIWLAENVSTFAKIWIYPNQTKEWKLVSWQKIPAWYMLIFLSFSMVAMVHKIRIKDSSKVS